MEVCMTDREERKLHFGCLELFRYISKMKFYLAIMSIEIRILLKGGI